MKISRKGIFIFVALLGFMVVISVYAGKEVFLKKFKFFLTERLENSTGKGLKIEKIGYTPLKGISFADVTVYENKTRVKSLFHAEHIYAKFPVIKFLKSRVLYLSLGLEGLKMGDARLNGNFGFSLKLPEKSDIRRSMLDSINDVWISGLSVKSNFFDIRKIEGNVSIDRKTIKSSGVNFIFNGEPCVLNLEIMDPYGDLSLDLKIDSQTFAVMLKADKKEEVYKITSCKGNLSLSTFDLTGEFKYLKGEPLLSLYGNASLDSKDVTALISGETGEKLKSLDLEGIFKSSLYFSGNVKHAFLCEIGVKSSSEYLKIRNYKFDNFSMDMRLKDGKLSIPLVNSYPYGGVLVLSATADITDKGVPYHVNCKLSNVNIAALLEDTELKGKGIKGFLSSELDAGGNYKNIDSMRGAGRLYIKDGNLGPMPLLTPLVGNIYGYLRGMLPELNRLDITKASADFLISDGKITSDNIMLKDDMIAISAAGYLGFDGSLNFDVENKFIEPEGGKSEDWRANLQNMIMQFGRMISKARLTGTVAKPKWKFEYLGGLQDILKGNLNKALKGIFE
ncbi:MAG: hypothetical protein JW994_00925 [Candidatus Omnitrophica bacterium]|nr:hypothetical protein [Candidatus Omnitrophota bacterium]